MSDALLRAQDAPRIDEDWGSLSWVASRAVGNVQDMTLGRVVIKQGKSNTYCHEVEVDGPSRVIYSSTDKPLLSCGARVVIATESPVTPILRAS